MHYSKKDIELVASILNVDVATKKTKKSMYGGFEDNGTKVEKTESFTYTRSNGSSEVVPTRLRVTCSCGNCGEGVSIDLGHMLKYIKELQRKASKVNR